jgi:hypothetical protein
MNIVYVGPDAGGVSLPSQGIHFPHGEAVDVDADLAESLLEQDTFARAATPERKDRNGKSTAAR